MKQRSRKETSGLLKEQSYQICLTATTVTELHHATACSLIRIQVTAVQDRAGKATLIPPTVIPIYFHGYPQSLNVNLNIIF
jgi:hypothetical protein